VSEVHEDVVNVKLAEILSRDFGIDARAERVSGRRRPDIRCYYRGLIIGIEASYDKRDAEQDAEERIKQGLADIALALWIKQRFKDIAEAELTKAIRNSKFSVKVFVPLDIRGTVLQFLEKKIAKSVEHTSGWFEDVELPTIKIIVENSTSFMIREEEIQELIKEMKDKFSEFINSLEALDEKGVIREKLYENLYKLYGLSIAEAKEPDVAFGHAALSILLSTVFYEHIRDVYPALKGVKEYAESYGAIEGLKNALENLLKIDYRAAVELTIEILKTLPPAISQRVRDLLDFAIRIASNKSLLRRDFAGRIYHEITGDIALKKGFATFYTEVPAAYLLTTLAISTLLGLDEKSPQNLKYEEARKIIDRISSVKIGDFACGSGTLLTASYTALMHNATMLKFYYNLEDVDLEDISRKLIEEGIYGIDALRYASQITAINLALLGPSTIKKENVYTIYLGYIPEKKQAWLGSLELLNNSTKVGGLLAYIEAGLKDVAEGVTVEGSGGEFSIPTHLNLLIMNPPFTRPTYRGEKPPEVERAFFGFIADKRIREVLSKRYKEELQKISDELSKIALQAINCELRDAPNEIRSSIMGNGDVKLRQYLNIGLAGEALPFLYLAYKYVSDGDVIAFVLPRAVLAGISWFLARTLLASKFHLKYIIVSSDPRNGYNFSEGADLSETMLIAKRTDEHNPSEETVFVILTKKPKTALEGLLTANSILDAKKKEMLQFSQEGVEFIMKIADRKTLIRHLDNWNRFVAIPEPTLSDYVFKLFTEGRITLGEIEISIPLTKLGNILKTVQVERKRGQKSVKENTKSIGIDAHQFYEFYTRVSTSPYPALIGTGEEFRRTIKIKPNAYITPKKESLRDKAINTFETYSGRILVPGVNVWWDTSHVIVLYSDQQLLSNTHYAIKLNVNPSIESYAEKAVVLWFNTTWGLLTLLVNREETRGRWAQVKMGQWILMPVLDVNSLSPTTLIKLAEVFDKYAEKPPKRIPEQFNPSNPDSVRLAIDKDFIKAFNPSIDDGILEKRLMELYNYVNTTFKLWIGSKAQQNC
jgi:hypothetical protein